MFLQRTHQRFQTEVANGDAQNRLRNWKAAERHYKVAVKIQPGAWWIWVQLGHSLKEQGRLAKGIAAYLMAASHAPQEADPQLHLGHSYKLHKDKERAIYHYKRAAELGAGKKVGFDALSELASLRAPISFFSIFQRFTAELETGMREKASHSGAQMLEGHLFDNAWYRLVYLGDYQSIDPQKHYISVGEKIGYCPNALFDPGFYSRSRGDANSGGAMERFVRNWNEETGDPHPLVKLENLPALRERALSTDSDPVSVLLADTLGEFNPHQFFDARWYLAVNPDVLAAGVSPFEHWMRSGCDELRDPHPLFSVRHYYQQFPRIKEAGINALVHFELLGSAECAEVHPLLDAAWYSARYMKKGDAEHPLKHYIRTGWKEGNDPHPLFVTKWYIENNPEAASGTTNPLQHFITKGWRQGRNPSPFFDLDWYRERYNVPESENPIFHFLALPKDRRVAGHPIIDTGFYKSDLKFDGVALVDYVSQGFENGFPPSKQFRHAVRLNETQSAFVEKATYFEEALITDFTEEADEDVAAAYFEWLKHPERELGPQVCLFAAYVRSNRLPDSTVYYLRGLAEAGVSVILIAARGSASSLDTSNLSFLDGILVRENKGYDFASWALALRAAPMLWKAKQLIFTNDSVFGPLSPESLKQVLRTMSQSGAGFCALTDSFQIKHHAQSYFFAIQNEALSSPAVKQLWGDVKSYSDKDRIIEEYELNLLKRHADAGVKTSIIFPSDKGDAKLDINPTLHRWEDLIRRGYPFIKVQLLRDTKAGMNSEGWMEHVRQNDELLEVILGRLNSQSEKDRAKVIE